MTEKEKFDTCRFRSKDLHQIEGASLIGCGGCFKGATEGYFCWKFSFVDVNEKICGVCASYAPEEVFKK